ncbi:MAG TPA: NrfD/PsrC family molybdoenzyme membrane anchor subunit [Dehalococcoidia bacterium]|nr:NrfD/PsrC family molybdoenzyme membrane anchor subunit [Dehalococcoidia bacterium]
MEGFAYPNEGVHWSILIVVYPYITGLVAGAFIVSSFYHVFGIQTFKPLARFSLVTALAFLLVAPLPLQAHLGRPERAFEIFLTPNPKSAMAGFGYIWLFYLILVLIEIWLAFRKDIVMYAQTVTGPRRLVYSFLTLGVTDISEASLRHDRQVIKVLAAAGIPSAFLLHGYVGFLFGSIKANPWWSTPLMPVIFPMSAIVSGIALLIVLYVVVTTMRGAPVDAACVRALGGWLFGFLVVDLALEGLEIVSMAYESEESWPAVKELITDKIAFSFFGLQLIMGSLVPLVGLGLMGLLNMSDSLRTRLTSLTAGLVLVGIFAMRWNVVIGGQLLSKSLRGFLSFTPSLGGREGILAAVILLALPLELFAIIIYFLPPWGEPVPAESTEEERAVTPLGDWRLP